MFNLFIQWRYVLFASLLAGELSFILSPFPAYPANIFPASGLLTSTSTELSTSGLLPTFSILQTIFPNRVPYQHILFLHQCFMFLSVALSRVVPQFIFIFGNGNSDVKKLDPVEKEIWERVYSTIAIADREGGLTLLYAKHCHSFLRISFHHPAHPPSIRVRETEFCVKPVSSSYARPDGAPHGGQNQGGLRRDYT